ncbi:MAG: hypothetical protein AAGA56_26095, partial [Myxococcota bacterium]
AFAFTASTPAGAARFTMRPTDLGTYLFFDQDGRYLSAETPGVWSRPALLESSLDRLERAFVSPAIWGLERSVRDSNRYQLRHTSTGALLRLDRLTPSPDDAAVITFVPQDDCAPFPELALDAEGEVARTTWPNGDVYGVAEIHSHLFHNVAFGGGGTFHGAPFHPLGVEHALPDCAPWHGEGGNRDVVGFFFDGGLGLDDIDTLASILIGGETPGENHVTAGYPDFVDWPKSWARATHQMMYYRWIERAYLAGLRLVVDLATGSDVLCELVQGIGSQGSRYECNDMVTVEEMLASARALERYIDAQAGGPGEGWLRIVESPAEAREVIREGKLALILGIEISNLFNCFLTPPDGFARCTEADVDAALDRYYDLGVRVIFPVHKLNNGFSAGDGDDGVVELANVLNSGHYSSFVEDCPGLSSSFDRGNVSFGGFNRPRDTYDAPPDFDLSGFGNSPLGTILPLLEFIEQPALEGDYCQNFGLTPLGEYLIEGMMARGIIPDIAHLPQRAMDRAYELLEARDYPATKTHGDSNEGRIYRVRGMTGADLGRCRSPDEPGAQTRQLRSRIEMAEAAGAFGSEALAFDLNGLAGGPRPRFGPDSRCSEPQDDRLTYPFTSFAGDVTFLAPTLGNRDVDFNTEGMIHIGLLPELIEDARRDGSDADLEPLFRSAEAYLRLWERAESLATISR